MTEELHSALVPLPAGGELALPDDLVERAKDYMAQALSERSRAIYAWWWHRFTGWCDRHGREPLPASPATIAAWMVSLADGTDTGRPLARASIQQALAALVRAHRAADYPFDRKVREISATLSGINRTKALTQPIRRVAPFMIDDLADLLAMLDLEKVIGCRDALLFTLGFSAGLRRSELVALDWEELGSGTGFVRIEARGILVTSPAPRHRRTRPSRSPSRATTGPRRSRLWSGGSSARRSHRARPWCGRSTTGPGL
jgi:integrase